MFRSLTAALALSLIASCGDSSQLSGTDLSARGGADALQPLPADAAAVLPDLTTVPSPDATVTAPPDLTSPGCQSNSDCVQSPTGHVCAQGVCVVCAADSDCGMGLHCAGQTACVQCITDANCSGATSHCNPTGHLCVGCLSDADCGAGTVCQMSSCAAGCNAAHPVCPMGQVCKLTGGACVGCLSDADCKSAGSPRCDTASNGCVACLPTNDNCPAGHYCSGSQCAPGCRSNADCAVSSGDGGMPTLLLCDIGSHACVQCFDDTSCPIGQLCSNKQCVAGCSMQRGCPSGATCCGGACATLASDNANCGICGKACGAGEDCCGGSCASLSTIMNCGACGTLCGTINNGVPACMNSRCIVGSCTGTWKDCDGIFSTGCEADTQNDATHCGACNNSCKKVNPNATCKSGACGIYPPFDANLVGYWSFDDPGPTAKDGSGNKNDGTVLRATQVTGKVGKAYSFQDGQCILVPNTPPLAMVGGSTMTVMAWVNYKGGCAGDHSILVNKEASYEMGIQCGATANFQEAIQVSGNGWTWSGAHPIPPSSWHHVAMTWDGTVVRNYVDGMLADSRPFTGQLQLRNSGFGIGCRNVAENGGGAAISSSFLGAIDEVAVYKRALSAAEIQAYYDSSK